MSLNIQYKQPIFYPHFPITTLKKNQILRKINIPPLSPITISSFSMTQIYLFSLLRMQDVSTPEVSTTNCNPSILSLIFKYSLNLSTLKHTYICLAFLITLPATSIILHLTVPIVLLLIPSGSMFNFRFQTQKS